MNLCCDAFDFAYCYHLLRDLYIVSIVNPVQHKDCISWYGPAPLRTQMPSLGLKLADDGKEIMIGVQEYTIHLHSGTISRLSQPARCISYALLR